MAGPEFTIGQLAQRSGFSASTLRYYERSGLLTPIARTGAGYRLYDETSQRRLRFVSRAKRLGCSLDPGEVDDRILAWRDLLRFVTERESIDGKPGDGAVGLRLVLDPTVPADDLFGLATAEQGCCTFFSFAVTIDERGLALEVRVPGHAAPVLDAVFGPRPGTDPSHR